MSRPVAVIGVVAALLGGSSPASGWLGRWEERPAPWVEALEEGRREDAKRLLETEESPPGRLAHAAALVALGDPRAALVMLGPSETEEPLAAVLAGRAVLELEPDRTRDAEAESRLAAASVASEGPILLAEARRLRLELLWRLERPLDYLELAREIPERERSDLLRWRMVQALEEPAAAHAASERIWRETPESPWAPAARRRARELEEAHPTLHPAALDRAQREEITRRLQKAGHHEDVLELTDVEEPGARLLALRAESAYFARRDEECLEAADRLAERYPGAERLPRALVFALRSLRRTDRTAEIRSRANAFAERRPADAAEVLFQLGDHVGNVRDPAEGLAILDRVSRAADPVAAEALWKGAWLARRLGDDAAARRRLEELADRFAGSAWEPAASYWVGRWAPEGPAAARAFGRAMATDPWGWYGQLAGERAAEAGLEPIGAERPPPPRFPAPRGRRDPGLERARELSGRGLFALAALELGALPDRDPALELTRARLEARAGRPERAAAIAGGTLGSWLRRLPPRREEALWRLALPLWPRPETFGPESPDPFLVLGLIRQESGFRADAVSGAGALGLLQLMPETAATIAADLGLAPPTRRELFDSELNLRLGLEELRRRIADHHGALAPAVASYNAGPAAVRPWWTGRPETVEVDEWIETIPYGETRLYVKKVLENWALYHRVWGEPVELLPRLRRDAGAAGTDPALGGGEAR